MFEDLSLLVSGDYNILKSSPIGGGIYAISGLNNSASFETPIYIGSTININYRIKKGHFDSLEKQSHANCPLQNYYNKYGKESLVAFLLEKCDNFDKLEEVEQKYIDYYGVARNNKAFNIQKNANIGIGYKHTEETKKRQSELKIGKKASEKTKKNMAIAQFGRKHPDSVKKKIALANTGKTRSEQQKQAISIKNAEIFHALDLNSGFIYEFSNLKKFCRINHISSANFLATRKQMRRKRCKNWVLMDRSFSDETK